MQPPGLTVTLHPYQLQSLAFMQVRTSCASDFVWLRWLQGGGRVDVRPSTTQGVCTCVVKRKSSLVARSEGGGGSHLQVMFLSVRAHS